jgi:hypothetical protein
MANSAMSSVLAVVTNRSSSSRSVAIDSRKALGSR